MNRIGQIALKELRHIVRDVRSLVIAILMPVLMTFLYGYAINLDIKNIKLAVFDFDHSQASRRLVSDFYNSRYFIPADRVPSLTDPEAIFKAGRAHVILTIRPGLEAALSGRFPYELGLLVDGADANLAAAVTSYSKIILYRLLEEMKGNRLNVPRISLSQQVLYNPDLKSSHFFVLGIIAVILMLISALLTSLTIAREKESGTMEQLLTTPVKPHEIIIGKVIPYIALAALDGLLVWAFGVFHFGIPINGSLGLLSAFGVIFLVAALSIGILISTLVKTQQVAMLATFVTTMMPSVLLSGFVFEIRNMPRVLQAITYIVPARYFISIIRGIMLKGSGFDVLWHQALGLGILALVLLTIAIKKFEIRST